MGGRAPAGDWLCRHLAALPPLDREAAEAALADLRAWMAAPVADGSAPAPGGNHPDAWTRSTRT